MSGKMAFPEGLKLFLCQACPVKFGDYLCGVGRGKSLCMSA